jgi:flagellar basal body-associated protein FliL
MPSSRHDPLLSSTNRHLDEYYSYSEDILSRQHPVYASTMLIILVTLLLFVAGYGMYQVMKSRQCYSCMRVARCATQELDSHDRDAVHEEIRNIPSRTPAVWTHTQMEMTPITTTVQSHHTNDTDYVSMKVDQGVSV